MGLARFACTSFSGAGAGEEQAASSANERTTDLYAFIYDLQESIESESADLPDGL
jgi:hypothetical protein